MPPHFKQAPANTHYYYSIYYSSSELKIEYTRVFAGACSTTVSMQLGTAKQYHAIPQNLIQFDTKSSEKHNTESSQKHKYQYRDHLVGQLTTTLILRH